ncbi:DUF4199 family protein [Leptobacterium flavescens]|uniref:DUF4199 family protein n=1 Tax=Leptobacterium flavescens TaxID=472055 RepID=A0A6P0UR52_9FLAO|nr:DUF4199 domain-containing protein [Leptobacterium flavescens]NER15367.1 DUF4199 family protein [Leptobacterium flavescens]
MKNRLTFPLLVGLGIALSGTVLMLLLLALGLVGPQAVESDKLMYGGTVLFISLYVFILIGLFISLKRRKKQNGDVLTFAEAMKTGLVTSLSAAVFSVLFTIIFYELIYPSYNPEMTEVITAKMEALQLSTEEIREKVEEQTKYYSTSVQAKFSFVGNLITGLAFSVLISLFLKTRKNA